MKTSIFILIILIFISGCGSIKTLLPIDYKGETATITDTFKEAGFGKTRIFYVKEINGIKIYNAVDATHSGSRGMGARFQTRGSERKIPIQPLNVIIGGTVYSSAPIVAMINAGKNYNVEGDIQFTPTPNEIYLVKGELGEDSSAVWIEDLKGNIKSNIIGNLSETDKIDILNKRKLKSNNPETQSRDDIYLNISTGESGTSIIKKLGSPTTIIEGELNGFTARKSDTQYIYDDLGTIYLQGKDKDSLFVRKTKKKKKTIKVDFDMNSIKKDLEKNEGETLQIMAKAYFHNKENRVEALDLFAQKIWEQRNSENPYTIDALAFLAITIGASKNPRYFDALEKTSKDTNSKKLLKHLKKNIKKLPEKNINIQYQIKE